MKLTFAFWILLVLGSCSSMTEERYRIEGTLVGGIGKSVYLLELSESNQFIIIDSAGHFARDSVALVINSLPVILPFAQSADAP